MRRASHQGTSPYTSTPPESRRPQSLGPTTTRIKAKGERFRPVSQRNRSGVLAFHVASPCLRNHFSSQFNPAFNSTPFLCPGTCSSPRSKEAGILLSCSLSTFYPFCPNEQVKPGPRRCFSSLSFKRLFPFFPPCTRDNRVFAIFAMFDSFNSLYDSFPLVSPLFLSLTSMVPLEFCHWNFSFYSSFLIKGGGDKVCYCCFCCCSWRRIVQRGKRLIRTDARIVVIQGDTKRIDCFSQPFSSGFESVECFSRESAVVCVYFERFGRVDIGSMLWDKKGERRQKMKEEFLANRFCKESFFFLRFDDCKKYC